MTDAKRPIPLVPWNPMAGPEDKAVAWACGTCGRVHMHESNAAYCHGIKKCEDCGVEMPYNRLYVICDACIPKREAAKEKERFDKATKLTLEEYEAQTPGCCGVVFCENTHPEIGNGDLGEDYWTMDFLADACEDADVPFPDYVYACHECRPHTDAQDVIENTLDNFYEDAIDNISDDKHAELQKLLDDWWDSIGIVGYEQDVKRVIVLKPKAGN